jgi:transcription-repair coupling factor (superfamily II helicase)
MDKVFCHNTFKDWATVRAGTVWGVPEGLDALALIHLAGQHDGGAVFIAADDAAMMRVRASVKLALGSDQDILIFPAWDCLPYDRVSPSGVLMGQRLKALATMCGTPQQPRLVLTTINAWLQRVPPPSYFEGASLKIEVGDALSQKHILDFTNRNAYRRCDTVREAGEIAHRGGIIDIFPPGYVDPVRIDFFDNEVETIKRFDAETQRSIETLTAVTLHPAGELMLNDETISTFRARYIELFGSSASKDQLYLSVSETRHHPGMEHMLPLFHDRLAMLSDYTGNAPVMIAPDVPAAMTARLDQINDFYQSRLDPGLEDDDKAEGGRSIWRPLPPNQLYLDEAAWASQEDQAVRHQISRFRRQDGEGSTGIDIGGKRGVMYHAAAIEGKIAGEDSSFSPSMAVAKAIPDLVASCGVVLAASTEGARSRMEELITEHLPVKHTITAVETLRNLKQGQVVSAVWPIEDGFTIPGLTVITEKDIYGARMSRPQGRRRRGENFLREVSALNTGDLVVHIDHGIGRYEGLEKITTAGVDHDCLLLIYAGGDKLFLPVENIDLLSRYGKDGGDAQLDKLGGVAWQARRARVKGRVKEIAEKLIKIAAARQAATAESITPDAGSYAEFCQRFPYAETEDQLEAINDTLGDLDSGRVMDRLICGDVGFGKTEVAMRAAFAVAMAGYQVAVVTPTTLLSRQHAQSFKERFKGFPICIGTLSRMTGNAAATRLKKDIGTGDCQIIIGTHALLSKSLSYSNLGLVIVDEEQNFGVAQKERLKSLRGDIHVLTLSATPIPRTLQMALSGVRDMSIIATPPVDRLAVRTSVGGWDSVVLAEAIRRERFRGGQVFCVCPRIEQLGRVYDRLLRIVPESRIITAHGQMAAGDLDDAMTKFGEGEADILLSTNIIESGIDIPSANTMIIHRADMLGLSQLYQLRGRVGRSRQRAYAYLTVDASRVLTANAKRRLEVMQTLDSLGAGFSLASYDLDIRGAGNLLGDEQSGHVREVGVELYQDMLKQAVKALKTGLDGADADAAANWSPIINMGRTVLIPDSYVQDLTVRLSLYRRIAAIENANDLDRLLAELVDRFGAVPDEVRNLLDTISIKILCRSAHIEKIDAGPKGLSLSFRNNSFPQPEKLIGHIAMQGERMRLTSDHRLLIMQTLPMSSRAKVIKDTLEELAALAKA